MKFISASNLLLIGFVVLATMPGKEQVDGFHLELLLLLPALLLKIGLAAPIVLALLGKLLLLLGLKGKAVVVPALLAGGGGSSYGHSSSPKTSYGSITIPKTTYGSSSSSDENLGRIKRSVDFVEGIVGKADISEEQFLETILKLDSNQCGMKLLCEVGSMASSQSTEKLDLDEAALLSLFSERDEITKENIGPAQQVYKGALISGMQSPDCSTLFPLCPFAKDTMMQLVHMIADTDVSLSLPRSNIGIFRSAQDSNPAESNAENSRRDFSGRFQNIRRN